MSNMSYCRFENTERDLADCYTALEAFFDGRGETLRSDELEAAKCLVAQCFDIVALMGRVYSSQIEETDEFETVRENIDQIIDDAQEAITETEDSEGEKSESQH